MSQPYSYQTQPSVFAAPAQWMSASSSGAPGPPPHREMSKCHFQTQIGLNTIRPCHSAYVRLPSGKFRQIQVFYDLGADLSQVTNGLIKATKLKPVNVLPELLIKVAGKESATSFGRSELHVVPIFDEFQNCIMRINCVAVDHIGQTNPGSYNEVKRKFEHFNDLTDLLEPASGKIHVLVGCNYPNLHPVPIQSIGTVCLAKCNFGKILYGSDPSFPSQSYERKCASSFMESMIQITDSSLCCPNLPATRCDTITARSRSPQMVLPDQNCTSPPAESPDATFTQLPEVSVHASSISQSDKELFERLISIDDQIACFRCGECPPERTPSSKEEQRRRDVYRDCLMYDPEKKLFTTRMPWIQDYHDLPDNRPAAEKRLASLTKSLTKDQAMKDLYLEEFHKMVQSGVLCEISPKEDRDWVGGGGKVWYVTHFPVFNASSTSTPVRIVFDPTVQFRGILLQRLWECPPNMLPDIPKMIYSFREGEVTISCDISKAYWSLFLAVPESHLHRVVFNDLNPDGPVKVYRMTRNSWSMAPAGSLCTLAMFHLAEMYRGQYPHVHKFVTQHMYVDDGVYSVGSIEEAITLARHTHHVLSQGGFHIKHFVIGGRAIDITVSEAVATTDLPETVHSVVKPSVS